MNKTFKIKLTGIIGHPISHSQSPYFQNAAIEAAGIEAAYLAFDISPEDVAAAISGLKVMGAVGINVTIPHKETVHNLCDVLSKEAELIGAVNTIRFSDKKIYGYNTDAYGFQQVILKNIPDGLTRKHIIICGAGGAARAAVAQALLDSSKNIIVANRTIQKVENMISEICAKFDELFPMVPHRSTIRAISFNEISEYLPSADILVNATSVGLDQNDLPLFDYKFISKKTFVFDMIYHKKTNLLITANNNGCRCTNGLDMLLFQGAKSFEIWFEQNAPLEIMRAAITKN